MRKQNRTRDGEAGHAEHRAIMIDRGLRSKRSLPPPRSALQHVISAWVARQKPPVPRSTMIATPDSHRD